MYLPKAGNVMVNGLMSCQVVSGVLTHCVLNSGATLDEFVNSVTWGLGFDGD